MEDPPGSWGLMGTTSRQANPEVDLYPGPTSKPPNGKQSWQAENIMKRQPTLSVSTLLFSHHKFWRWHVPILEQEVRCDTVLCQKFAFCRKSHISSLFYLRIMLALYNQFTWDFLVILYNNYYIQIHNVQSKKIKKITLR